LRYFHHDPVASTWRKASQQVNGEQQVPISIDLDASTV
jgi:hypothetical protein